MNTTKWGPYAWVALHSIVDKLPATIDEDQQEGLHIFFDSMKAVLPCKYCRESFTGFLKQHPLVYRKVDGKMVNNLATRSAMKQWLYEMHNLVNDKLRKQKVGTGEYFPPNPTPSQVDARIASISPSTFNTGLWMFLHAVSMNYEKNSDPDKKYAYQAFFYSIATLPFPPLWKQKYTALIGDLSIRMNRPDGLFDFIYDVRSGLDRSTPSYGYIEKTVGSWKAKCKVFKGWSGGTCR